MNDMIRAATVDDVPFLRAMIWEAVLASPRLIARLGLDAIARLEDEYWRSWTPDGAPAFLMHDQGAIILKADLVENGMTVRWRIGIGVVAGERGRGVGRALVEHAIERARALRAREVSLLVDHGNARALALYAKIGFTQTGERPDAIEMKISL